MYERASEERAKLQAKINEPHPAQIALERDRSKVAECVTAMKSALHNYSWLIEGRGSYEWDDDRWHDEFRHACDNIAQALGPLIRIAADWSNCPSELEDVLRARASGPHSYHDLHITTNGIPRTSIFNLPFNIHVLCTRVGGWEVWDSHGLVDHKQWTLLGGEYDDEKPLTLDVGGMVICGK